MTTVTLDEAQKSFDSLAQRALQGESIRIRVDHRFLSLQTVAPWLDTNVARFPELQPTGIDPHPFHGGVGLIVYNGTISVSEFRVTPLK